jgi:hypothetical protein
VGGSVVAPVVVVAGRRKVGGMRNGCRDILRVCTPVAGMEQKTIFILFFCHGKEMSTSPGQALAKTAYELLKIVTWVGAPYQLIIMALLVRFKQLTHPYLKNDRKIIVRLIINICFCANFFTPL